MRLSAILSSPTSPSINGREFQMKHAAQLDCGRLQLYRSVQVVYRALSNVYTRRPAPSLRNHLWHLAHRLCSRRRAKSVYAPFLTHLRLHFATVYLLLGMAIRPGVLPRLRQSSRQAALVDRALLRTSTLLRLLAPSAPVMDLLLGLPALSADRQPHPARAHHQRPVRSAQAASDQTILQPWQQEKALVTQHDGAVDHQRLL